MRKTLFLTTIIVLAVAFAAVAADVSAAAGWAELNRSVTGTRATAP
jgi:hypothetical protein